MLQSDEKCDRSGLMQRLDDNLKESKDSLLAVNQTM